MKSCTHPTKNDLTVWAPDKAWGPTRFGGPVSTFVPPEKFFSEPLGGLRVRVGCKDRLCANSDADETLPEWESRYVSEVLPHSCENIS